MNFVTHSFNSLPAVVRGPIWMILGGLSLLAMAVVIRHLQTKFHILEMIFLRSVISLFLILPWALRQNRSELVTKRLPLHVFRNGIHYLGNIGWFLGVTLVTLADLQALQFTTPLFVVVMAALFLRESVGPHRWIATALGFVGALVIIRPGFIEISFGTAAVVMSAFFYASSQTATKALSRTDAPNAILLYMALIFIPISAVPAAFVWVTPSWEDLIPILLLGLSGYWAHSCMIRSFATADASFVMPFDFLRLPFAALLGFFLYQEWPEIWVWIGAVIIFVATYYITWRESLAAKQSSP